MKYLLICDFISWIDRSFLKISSSSIQSNTFNNSIKRVLQTMPLFLLTREQYPILNLIKQARTLRISQYDLYLLIPTLQIFRNTRQCTSSSTPPNKAIHQSLSLSVNLRSSSFFMNFSILNILKLISKISFLLNSIFLCKIKKMIWNNNRYRRYFNNISLQSLKQ